MSSPALREPVLVAVPTLGDRRSILRTIESLESFREELRIVVVAPAAALSALEDLFKTAGLNDINIIAERASGQAAAIATGWDSAKSEWVTWINDDDYALSGFGTLLGMIGTVNERIVFGDIVVRTGYESRRVRYPTVVRRWQFAGGRCYVPGVLALIHRSVIDQVDLATEYDITFDSHWWVRMLRYTRARNAGSVVGCWVDHPGARTVAQAGVARSARNRMLREEFSRFSYRMVPRPVWRVVAALVAKACLSSLRD